MPGRHQAAVIGPWKAKPSSPRRRGSRDFASARRAWFDKLTTDGSLDKLTTDGSFDKLTTDGSLDKLTKKQISGKLR
jgi:hypothetical protein